MKKVNNICFVIVLGILAGSCKYSRKVETIDTNKMKIEQSENLKYKYALIEGEKQFILGNFNAARLLMEECIKYNSYSSVPYYNLAKIDLRNENLAGAKENIKVAINKNYKSKWYYKLLTQIHIKNNDIDGAINSTKELIQLEPEELSDYFYLADLYISKNDYKQVLTVYDDIERIGGYSTGLKLERIKLLDILGENGKAKEELLKLIEIDPYNAYYYGLLAEFYVEDIEYEKALKMYEKVRKLEPDNGIIHLSMFEFYTRIGDKEKALVELENAVKHSDVPTDSKIQAIVGLDLLYPAKEIKNLKELLINYLIDNYPDDTRISLLKVENLMNNEQYNEAKEILKNLTGLNKSNFYIWQQLMLVESIRNDNTGLKINSEEALSIFPNQPVFYLFNGIANYNLKKYDDAISILKSGIDFSKSNNEIRKQIFTYIGEAYYKKQSLDNAFGYFDKALEIDSNNTYVLNNYSYYLALENIRLINADNMMKRCINLNSENSSYLDTYAWVLFKMKNYKEALNYIEKAYLKGGDSSAVILEHYGDILFKNGYRNQAIDKWNKALKIGSKSEDLKKKIESGELKDEK